MMLFPSYIDGKEREIIKETKEGQEVFYFENDEIIIRNFLPEDANAWCICMHPEFIRIPVLKKKEILKDIRRRINEDLNPEYSSDDILEYTLMLTRKNGKMFGTLALKEFPAKGKQQCRTVIKLWIRDSKDRLEIKTLEALRQLRDEYYWYDNIMIQNADYSEISLDEEIMKKNR